MKIIGIYPSQFQPPHRGHLAAYKRLHQYSRENTYVVTTDYDPTVKAPLHFGDKEQILVRLGIPSNRIKKVAKLIDPETHQFVQPDELLHDFDETSTVVIYALQHAVAKNLLKTDYYKSVVGVGGKYEPYKKRAYILVVDDSIIDGKIVTSDKIREALGSHQWTKEQKVEFFEHFFGFFDLGLFELLKNKYTNAKQTDMLAAQSGEVFAPPIPPENIREILSKEIVNILNELMGLPPSIATDPSSAISDTDALKTDAEKRKEDADKRLAAQKQKTASERELKSLESDKRWKKRDILSLEKDKIPDKRDELDTLNKQLANKNSL